MHSQTWSAPKHFMFNLPSFLCYKVGPVSWSNPLEHWVEQFGYPTWLKQNEHDQRNPQYFSEISLHSLWNSNATYPSSALLQPSTIMLNRRKPNCVLRGESEVCILTDNWFEHLLVMSIVQRTLMSLGHSVIPSFKPWKATAARTGFLFGGILIFGGTGTQWLNWRFPYAFIISPVVLNPWTGVKKHWIEMRRKPWVAVFVVMMSETYIHRCG